MFKHKNSKLKYIIFFFILFLIFEVKTKAQQHPLYIPKNWESFKQLPSNLTDSTGYIGRLYHYSIDLFFNNSDGQTRPVTNYYYAPEGYGAVGDGVTDDTVAFNNMISDMGSNYGSIYLDKTYYINGANGLTFTNKVVIFGPGGFIIGSGVGNHAGITIAGNGSYLQGFSVVGDHSNFLNTALTIELRRSIMVTADYVVCDNLTDTNSIVGISLEGTEHCVIKYCNFTNDIIQAGPGTNNYNAAIYIIGSSYNKIMNNNVSGYGNGVLHGGSSYKNVINCNEFYRADNNSIYISSGQWIEICGNVIKESDDSGIKVRDSYHLVCNNLIDQNSWAGGLIGIAVTGNGASDPNGFNGENTLVIGNIIKGKYTAGLRTGEQDGGYFRNPHFSNNIIELTGDPNVSLYGIHLKGRSQNAILTDNIIKNAVFGIHVTIDDPNTDTHKEILINNNQVFDSITYGIIAVKATGSINGNFVEGDVGTPIGIYTSSWNDRENLGDILSIRNNYVKGPYATGIYVYAETNYYLERVNIDNNNVEIESGGGYGIRLYTHSRDAKITNNRITGHSIGIYVSIEDPNVVHSGMLIANNFTCRGSRDGISLSNVTDSLITNNVSINNASGRSGITLVNSLRNEVINNYVGDNQDTATQKYGIRETGTSDYNMIIDNKAEGLTSSGLNRYTIVGSHSLVEVNRMVVETLSGDRTFEIGEARTFVIDPGGAARNFSPRVVTWPRINELILINTADGAETITFDVLGLNQAVAQNERGIFVFDGTSWLKVYVGS